MSVPAASAARLQMEIVGDAAGFDGLAPEWDRLLAESDEDNVFRRFLWQRLWWKHFGGSRRLLILTARHEGELVGLAPLFVNESLGWLQGRTLQFLGAADGICAEYLGFLIRRGWEAEVSAKFLDRLSGDLANAWDVFHVSDLPAESPQVPCLERWLAERRLPCLQEGRVHRVVELPATWQEYEQGLGHKKRRKAKKAIGGLGGLGEVQFEHADSPASFDRVWKELQDLHTRHWQGQGQAGCFAEPRWRAFHDELARELLAQGMLLLSAVRVDGQAVAAAYALRQGENLWEYQRGHDPDWKKHHPGHTLQFEMFRVAIESGVRRWDFLRGDYPHKRDWATTVREVREFLLPSPRLAARLRFRLVEQYRRQRRRLGQWKRDLQQRWARKPAPSSAPAPTSDEAAES